MGELAVEGMGLLITQARPLSRAQRLAMSEPPPPATPSLRRQRQLFGID